MNEQDFYPESSRSLDSLRHMRLMALLRDMIDDGGKVRAAKALGVNYRTVSKAVGSGTLTDRMSDALEQHLLLGGGSAGAQQRERVAALEQRLVRLEAGGHGSETPSPTGADSEPGPKRRYAPSRPYPQLVTLEAEPDEDLVYGDAAPVIVEWREARAEFHKALKTGATLDRTEVQEPMLELEIAIVGEHGLTLPPASFPWDEFDRRDKVWERTQDLKRVRAERNRALLRRWLRRVLTFELWRK